MVVRMRETRVIVTSPKNPEVLRMGMEYDLPKEFAAFLITEGKADFRPGRLHARNPRAIGVPQRKENVRLSRIVRLDD